ncbi:MAG TPA: LLM class flavin-dependent oxidoreductase [Beijerinckiaceae bacterium]|nr:LLM class flavin-dependent oxidoreductase [Beijerinckiaceae bacterium]
MDPVAAMSERMAMYSANRLKIGLFGANCSSGRAVTLVPERWSGGWDDCVRLAQMADEAGLEFLLPIGRYRGYGGDSDYQGATLETIAWACGLLATTKRVTVFATVHAPLFNPIVAAKQFATADHIGHGRFGLNVVCGWKEGEFDMFSMERWAHDEGYDHAQEWLDIIKLAWSGENEIAFKGEHFDVSGVRSKPKPYGGTRPLIMNAGSSGRGRAYALRNCDAFFTGASRDSLEQTAANVKAARTEAAAGGRELDVYTVGVVTCRPTIKEAQDYHHYSVFENADWKAVDAMMALKKISAKELGAEAYERKRAQFANGMNGCPLIGDPDAVASGLAELSGAGLRGIALSFVNYLDELPLFRDEVLPRLERLGVREPSIRRTHQEEDGQLRQDRQP